MTTIRHRAARRPLPAILAAVAGAAGLTLAMPLPAGAHVSMDADTTAAGAHAVLTLSIPHGCEGSPTTGIAVRIPQGINAVIPTVHSGWKVSKKVEQLQKPVQDAHGETLTSRIGEVVWTAKEPLAEGYRDTVSLQVMIPESAAGQQLSFPTVQSCTRGETAWTEVPAAGQDPHDLERPAPSITVTGAAGHHGAGDASEPATGGQDDAVASDSAGSADAQAATTSVQAELTAAPATTSGGSLGVAGLVLGGLGLLAGTTALLRTRSTSARQGI